MSYFKLKPKHQRLISILLVFFSFAFGMYLALSSIRDNIVFFHPPSELDFTKITNKKIRVGGIVKEGTVIYGDNSFVEFIMTDNIKDLRIKYQGTVPVLFRESQGIIADGLMIFDEKLQEPFYFQASSLLTKHDENYKPKYPKQEE